MLETGHRAMYGTRAGSQGDRERLISIFGNQNEAERYRDVERPERRLRRHGFRSESERMAA
jgi:hypothetical protein